MCLSTTPKIIPTRPINVGPADGSKDPFLFAPAAGCSAPVERKEPWTPTPDTTYHYLALSYCWGTGGNLTITIKNIDVRKNAILWNEIPQTIEDAISVIRKLG